MCLDITTDEKPLTIVLIVQKCLSRDFRKPSLVTTFSFTEYLSARSQPIYIHGSEQGKEALINLIALNAMSYLLFTKSFKFQINATTLNKRIC